MNVTLAKISAAALLSALGLGAAFAQKPDTTLDFSRVIRDNVSRDVRIVDIAMLGAHNAFTDNISRRSPIDPHNTNKFVTSATASLVPGMISRQMKAQKSDAKGLLLRGVRYFDVRLTFYNNTWYTHHSMISAPLEVYLIQIIDFLSQNPGELIVFDIQHIRLDGNSFEDLWNFVANTTSNGRSLFDFVTYNPHNTPLDELTLGNATQHGAGVVVLAKTPTFEGGFHYLYSASVRSKWHNKIRSKKMIQEIQNEYLLLMQNPELARNKFRVNQAQTTPNFNGFANSVSTLFGGSLVRRNARHNTVLLRHENFSDWLTALPILMVDFSDSPKNNFNVLAIEKINEFNRNL
jgi:hypothetical protein